MTDIYLVRHGQAGDRESYDSLSELGRRQSRLLGEYFVSQEIKFAAAYTGGQLRQRQTAVEVSAAYADAGVAFPGVTVDNGWNEFDLDQIYREMAPQLCAEDSEFRREYDSMREQLRASAGVHGAKVHRRWSPCDTKIVEAWIRGRYPYSGETWEGFWKRVAACQPLAPAMNDTQRRANVVVFTSAMPTAIWTGLALEIFGERVMRLAGVLHNASFTLLRQRRGQMQLFTFNAVPHLAVPELRTHR